MHVNKWKKLSEKWKQRLFQVDILIVISNIWHVYDMIQSCSQLDTPKSL